MTDPALLIRNLKFRYDHHGLHSNQLVVDVPHLELARGQQVLLIGSSGRGKSTLLHLIAGLIDPMDGEVLVTGERVHALRGAARDQFRGRHIGMIFQTFNLLQGFTAIENVMAALMFADPKRFPPATHRERARELLAHLDIKQVDAVPEQLSVGQQQRVAVARAIACEPVLVLADEPTASLDPTNAAVAMDLIQRICAEHNAALLCVSHDPAMAERFEHRASLDELSQRGAHVLQ